MYYFSRLFTVNVDVDVDVYRWMSEHYIVSLTLTTVVQSERVVDVDWHQSIVSFH